jgi:hypothetical protein
VTWYPCIWYRLCFVCEAWRSSLSGACTDRALRYMQEEAYWDALEKTGVAWAVTTIDAPYIVMHATTAWYRLFNIPHGSGSYHHMYSIMSLIGRDSTVESATGATLSTMNALNTTSFTSSNAYVGEWKDPTTGGKNNKSTHHQATNALLTEMHEGYRTNQYKEVHGVLCFSLANKKAMPESPRGSRGSFSIGTHSTASAVPQGHNLMCTLHVYPIFANPVSEEGKGAPEEPGNASATPRKNPLSSLTVRVPGDVTVTPPPGHRGLVTSSPARETFTSALTGSLASVNVGRGTPVPGAAASTDAPLLRRSATQTPQHPETPTPLRRTNTQVSHASFASSIRTSFKPDGPRPAYYAIQFHELSECQPAVVGDDGVLPPGPPASPRSLGGQSPDTTSSILSALLPNIGRFWSSEKTRLQHTSALSSSAGSGSAGPQSWRSGSFGYHEGGWVHGGSTASRDSRNSRHSVS